jgi:hypothetical protein
MLSYGDCSGLLHTGATPAQAPRPRDRTGAATLIEPHHSKHMSLQHKVNGIVATTSMALHSAVQNPFLPWDK